ncbi:MAG: hypothetical protein RLZZ511_1198 [Cyanobacteriota bacterium]|jgi:nucleoside-diphosphate-sugar epimerase
MVEVLVTGSSGFIGNFLCDFLHKKGIAVLGIDIHQPSCTPLYLFEKCDLLDRNRFASLITQYSPKIVIHLAARTDLNGSHIDEYSVNTQGVQNLIEGIRQSSSVRRCIFTSSQLVCRVGYIPQDVLDYCPNTIYGESKVLTEKIVRDSNGGDVNWCIVRPTTVWGPGLSPHYQKFLRMIQKGRYFHVGNKHLFKSYSYIGNIVYQYAMLADAPSEHIHQQIFYLADYEPLSLREWANIIQRKLNARSIPTYPEILIRLAARVGDLLNTLGIKSFPFNSFRLNNVLTEYVFDLKNTEKICGSLPYSVDAGVDEMISWLRKND